MVMLRPIYPEDRERILDILTSEKITKTYMLPDFRCREDAAPLFTRLMELCRDKSKYVRAIANEGALIGFLNHTDIRGGMIELGYVIHPDFHGKGYMTEALKLAIQELFEMGYQEVTAGAFSTNPASIRVMEKCGMRKLDKTDEIEYRGEKHTCVYYSKKSAASMAFSCCFCGKPASAWDAYTLTVRRTNDPERVEQDLFCHRKCMEKKLKDPKLLYLKYM